MTKSVALFDYHHDSTYKEHVKANQVLSLRNVSIITAEANPQWNQVDLSGLMQGIAWNVIYMRDACKLDGPDSRSKSTRALSLSCRVSCMPLPKSGKWNYKITSQRFRCKC
jgi:hypothetical protein